MSTKAVLFLGAPCGEEDERLVWGPSCLKTSTQDGSDQQQSNQQRSNSFSDLISLYTWFSSPLGWSLGILLVVGFFPLENGILFSCSDPSVISCFKCEVNNECMNNLRSHYELMCIVHTSIRHTLFSLYSTRLLNIQTKIRKEIVLIAGSIKSVVKE